MESSRFHQNFVPFDTDSVRDSVSGEFAEGVDRFLGLVQPAATAQ